MKIYVGNLADQTTETELRDAFGAYGSVSSVAIITDKQTGQSRGFGFVEMEQEEGERAVADLDGTEFMDQVLKVNEARPRSERAQPQHMS